MGLTQSNGLINEETLLRAECYGGYFNADDTLLGPQKYMRLQPGCSASIEGAERFQDGVILLIAARRGMQNQASVLRLSFHGQSLANVPASRIFLPIIQNGQLSLESLESLGRNVTNGNAIANAINANVGSRRVGQSSNGLSLNVDANAILNGYHNGVYFNALDLNGNGNANAYNATGNGEWNALSNGILGDEDTNGYTDQDGNGDVNGIDILITHIRESIEDANARRRTQVRLPTSSAMRVYVPGDPNSSPIVARFN